jgi:NitT/TauT family transport system ATP-binding protein
MGLGVLDGLPAKVSRAADTVTELVRFEGAGLRYATGVEAVAGLDLAVEAGSFVALLGPSGCGKSTALRMLAGLESPTAGRIAWADARPETGFVFQDPTLMPWADALTNAALALELEHIPRAAARERAAAALDAVGLGGFARALPRELSGGMRMRVSIARALALRPQLLLMDEPFAALDEFTRVRLNDDLLDLWARERFTCLFVTHSIFESVSLATRIVVMSGRPGRIVADLANPAPYPRGDAYRMSAAYHALCAEALGALRRAAAL